MSLARLLNGPAFDAGHDQGSSRSKRARPSAGAMMEDEDSANRRASSRHTIRPKRYGELLGEDDYETAFLAPGRGPNGQFMPKADALDVPYFDDGDIDDEDEPGLMKSTAHIWRTPLEQYIRQQHVARQKLISDWAVNEESRQFKSAARITEMADRKLAEFDEYKTAQVEAARLEAEAAQRELEKEQRAAEREEAQRVKKEQEREVRLAKQREANRKKRESDKAKKEKEEEARRIRREEDRLAKEREVERRANLTPDELALENRQMEEAAAKAREDQEARLRELDAELLDSTAGGAAGGPAGGVGGAPGPSGRSRAKRKRAASDVNLEEDAVQALTGLGHMNSHYITGEEIDELDELGLEDPDDDDPDAFLLASSLKGKGKGRFKRAGSEDEDPDYYSRHVERSVAAPGFYPYDAGAEEPAYYPATSAAYGSAYADPVAASMNGHDSAYVEGGSSSSKNARGGAAPPGSNIPLDQQDPKALKATAIRRWRAIEELERKVWHQIAKRDIPKVTRIVAQTTTSRQFFAKRISTIVAREAKRASTRTKPVKDTQIRARRLMRETLLFAKGNEKRERESRRKAEKEALDKAKKEEEAREAKRQARKLNFLITQTELYSHFVGSKIKTKEAEDSADTAADATLQPESGVSAAVQAAIDAGEGELKELDFDDDDERNAALHARANAQAAVEAARKKAADFDAAAAAENGGGDASLNFDGDEMNFQNPTSLGEITIKQPSLLNCTLKEYQLKGLNWLANLYEQGINGILADEMGLGKTVQSISLMAYLAEVQNIWGPFLVIAPASTLHNWQQEITRFVPSLKALPYWGNQKDRAVLRKFWNRKSLRYDKDAPFHILVTSYQLVVQDEKYFQRVKWQYMVLDEAQAIKSSSSARWKTLLGFHCRNRLLLTGTPIQNSMHELWALLHFIMPSLFDSHDEFSEWFSKDIETNAENKSAMNEHQLRRLHMILKPFMLRRIKKNVQNELGEKIELDVYCELTARQKFMYRTLRQNISINDLVARASSLNDDDSVKRLMNLIMQFRKVCNHPELFERADVTAPFAFASFSRTANLIRDGPVLDVHYGTGSEIELKVPRLVFNEGLQVPGETNRRGFETQYLDKLMNVWTPDYIHRASTTSGEDGFAFTGLLKLSPAELAKTAKASGFDKAGLALEQLQRNKVAGEHQALAEEDGSSSRWELKLPILAKSQTLPNDPTWRSLGLTPLDEIEKAYRSRSRLSRADARFYMSTVVAPTISAYCSDRRHATLSSTDKFDTRFSEALYGVPAELESEAAIDEFEKTHAGLPAKGILAASAVEQLPFPPMQVPQLEKLILDSGKLAKLDSLLAELKTGGHRCLVYFQMTKMIDLMEEYLSFRQYKYLRLDGSSTISERRDMVTDWQTKPEIFIFLLSTRAGGLGINLTAADTVIFYDSDWNPSNDLQAMDRAHRLGQTKQVTVYRLITRGTVDERIVRLARTKKQVQDAVVGSSAQSYDTVAKPNEVAALLLGDDELEESLKAAEAKKKAAEEKMVADGKKGAQIRQDKKKEKDTTSSKPSTSSGWGLAAMNDDDDDGFSFFAAGTGGPQLDDDDMGGTGTSTPVPTAKKGSKKRKAPAADGDAEPRKPKKKKTAAAAAAPAAE